MRAGAAMSRDGSTSNGFGGSTSGSVVRGGRRQLQSMSIFSRLAALRIFSSNDATAEPVCFAVARQ